MYQRITFCLFMLIGLTVNAQTINVRGTVSNVAGKPIAKAIVSLAGQGLKDTTGTDGTYSFSKSAAVKSLSFSRKTEQIALNGGILELGLTHPSAVKIEIFNAKGDILNKEFLQNALAGVYRVNIAKNCHAANLLFIHASIGSHAMTFRYLSLNNGKYTVNSSVESFNPAVGKLAIAAAVTVNDTLKTTATGYMANAAAISSYDTVVTITLDTAGGAVTVQLNTTEQTMVGFGINDSWAPAMTAAEADSLFDTTNGIGLTILRIGMGTNGSQMSSNMWGDIGLAKARGVATFIASVWSAPANYKSNNNVNDGGYLDSVDYNAWATTIAAFPAVVKSNAGVDLYAMSPANEPDFASCGMSDPCNGDYPTMLFTASEMVAFVKALGPKLKAASPNVKLLAPEPSEWIHLWTDSSAPGSTNPLKGVGYDYGHALYKDSTAWAQVDILGAHEYDTQVPQPWPSDVPRTKPIWMTEMSGVKWWPQQGPSSNINNGVAVAQWIHNALVEGPASAWCYWWWQAQGTNDNEGLLLQNGTVCKRFYTLGNFSKFIRPGYLRVDVTGTIPANILLSAYTSTGGADVVVAVNTDTLTTNTVTVPISFAGGTAPTSLTPYLTSANVNLAAQTAITVTGGSFTASLPAATVTTFVGR